MRTERVLLTFLLIAVAPGPAAAQISCTNAADIAAVKAALKRCEDLVPCNFRMKTVETMVADFNAGKRSLQECSSTLKGIYEFAQSAKSVPPSSPPPPPRGGGGGGGGGIIFF